jgi:hypothetical protein
MSEIENRIMTRLSFFSAIIGIVCVYITLTTLSLISDSSLDSLKIFLKLATFISIPILPATWIVLKTAVPWLFTKKWEIFIKTKYTLPHFIAVYLVINLSAFFAGFGYAFYNNFILDKSELSQFLHAPLVAFYIYNIFSIWCAPFIFLANSWYWNYSLKKQRLL